MATANEYKDEVTAPRSAVQEREYGKPTVNGYHGPEESGSQERHKDLQGLKACIERLSRDDQATLLVELARNYFKDGLVLDDLKQLLRNCSECEQKLLPALVLQCYHGEALKQEVRVLRADGDTYAFCSPPALRHQRAMTTDRAAELASRLERSLSAK